MPRFGLGEKWKVNDMRRKNKDKTKRLLAGVVAGVLTLIFVLGMILPFLIR